MLFRSKIVFSPTRDDFEACSDVVKCRMQFSNASSLLDRIGSCRFVITESTLARKQFIDAMKSKICASCRARWDECYAKGSKGIWDKLPSYFDLPPWEELRKQSGLDDHLQPIADSVAQ